MKFTFKIEKDAEKWHAFCPEIKGCHTFGATKKEAIANLKDAIMLYLEDEIENESMKALINAEELEQHNVQI